MKHYEVRVVSKTRPDTVHTVTINHDEEKGFVADTFDCTCEAIMFRRTTECKHIEAVSNALWDTLFLYDIPTLEGIVNAR